MAIQPADMESCSIKSRCLSGANEGLAYDSDKPCPDGFTFDPVTCNCISECYEGASGTLVWTVNYETYSWTGCGAFSCYVNCSVDYWRSCGIRTASTTRCLDNVQCLVVKGFADPPPVHCGQTAPCEYGRFIYLYSCADSLGESCALTPITFVDVGSQCGACANATYSISFTPNPKVRTYNYEDAIGTDLSKTSTTTPIFSGPRDCGTYSSGVFCYYDVTTTNCAGQTIVQPTIAYGPNGSTPSYSLVSTGPESYCSC